MRDLADDRCRGFTNLDRSCISNKGDTIDQNGGRGRFLWVSDSYLVE